MASAHFPDFRYLRIDEPGIGIVRCTMSNPPRHTLVAAAVAELETFAAALLARDDVRVAIFTGGGEGIFIRHYDVGELADASERRAAGEQPPSPKTPHRFHRLLLTLQQAPLVTIAAMNGNAAGGGLEFALGCDFRVLADGDYRIGLPETGVGIIPGAGGTQRFARLLGVAKALDLILHGTLLNPQQALALGLVHELLPEADFGGKVLEYATVLAARSPIALAAAKEAIYRGANSSLTDGLLLEQQLFARCMASEDAAQAMRNALSGKTWRWRGR